MPRRSPTASSCAQRPRGPTPLASAPTTTTASPWPSPSWACASPASRWTAPSAWRRRSPTTSPCSPRCGPAGGRVITPMRVIAIDGPAGAGKSTVAKALAHRLGLDYLDTGAMYRGVAFAALRRGIDPEELEPVGKLAIEVELDVGEDRVMVDGVDAAVEIRGPEVTRAVSAVAANPRAGAELRRRQLEWARQHGGGVIEGRDIGSVVFPNADLKLYLTASADVRASRRYKEVSDLNYEEVAASIAERDARDQGRAVGPLMEADDAVVVDTTNRDVSEIVDEILALLPPCPAPAAASTARAWRRGRSTRSAGSSWSTWWPACGTGCGSRGGSTSRPRARSSWRRS